MKRESASIILAILVISSISLIGFYIRPTKAVIWIEGHITSDTTWTSVDIYRIINDTYVDPGATLTIEPDAQIEIGDNFSLIVEGSLNATGAEGHPIVFTSTPRPSPTPGIWNTIKFVGNETEFFTLKHTTVEYGTHGVTIQRERTTILEKNSIYNCSNCGIYILGKWTPSGILIIRENTLKHNLHGIRADSATNHQDILIENNLICYNENYGIYLHSSVYGNGRIENVTVANNIITNNGGGINMHSISSYGIGNRLNNLTFSSNTISNNNGVGIRLRSSGGPRGASLHDVAVYNNTVSNNGGTGISMLSSSGSSGASLYRVSVSNNTISNNRRAGVNLGCSASYAPNLHHVTISNNTISNNGGAGIFINPQAYYFPSQLHDVNISNNSISLNGRQWDILDMGWEMGNGIFLHGGSLYNVTISNNTLLTSSEAGICASGGSYGGQAFDLYIDRNVMAANKYGSRIAGGIRTYFVANSIGHNTYGIFYVGTNYNWAEQNDIYRNAYGMNVTDGATVKAEYNYWGNSSGPHHYLNPEGTGNPVNGNGTDLDFIPFLTSPLGAINERPVAILEVDKDSLLINETVTFNATGSFDDGNIQYYFFNFGDGTNSSWTTSPIVTHEYVEAGSYNVTLTVVDDFGIPSLDGNLVYTEISVIPELPSPIILLVFMMVTLLGAISYRIRRHNKK